MSTNASFNFRVLMDGRVVRVPAAAAHYDSERLIAEKYTVYQLLLIYNMGNQKALGVIARQQARYRRYYVRVGCSLNAGYMEMLDIDGIFWRALNKAVSLYSWKSSFVTFIIRIVKVEVLHEINRISLQGGGYYVLSLDNGFGEEDGEGEERRSLYEVYYEKSPKDSPKEIAQCNNTIERAKEIARENSVNGEEVVRMLMEGYAPAQIARNLNTTRYRINCLIDLIKKDLWEDPGFDIQSRYNYE